MSMLEAEGHPVLPGLAGPISCYCWGPAGQPAAPPARDQLLLSASRQQTADHYGPLFSTNDDDTTDPTDPVTVASQPVPPCVLLSLGHCQQQGQLGVTSPSILCGLETPSWKR